MTPQQHAHLWSFCFVLAGGTLGREEPKNSPVLAKAHRLHRRAVSLFYALKYAREIPSAHHLIHQLNEAFALNS